MKFQVLDIIPHLKNPVTSRIRLQSGVTTYAANRSLTVTPGGDGSVVLDFNRAVNLPCAYTDLASCPLRPAENRLTAAIEAGEQIPYERQEQQ